MALSLVGGGRALPQANAAAKTPPPVRQAEGKADLDYFGARIAELEKEAKDAQENPKLDKKRRSALLAKGAAEVGKIATRFANVSSIQGAAAKHSLQLGDTETALKRANRAVTVAAKANDTKSLMKARKVRALAYYRAGDFPKAYRDAFAVIKKIPRDTVAHTIVLLTKGRAVKLNSERVPEADLDQIELILEQTSALRDPRVQKILQDNARRLKARMTLSSSARKLSTKDSSAALFAAQRAFDIDPGDPDASMQLALAFLGLGMYKGTVASASTAIDLGPRKGKDWRASAYGLRAMALLELSEFDKALADASRVVIFQPDNASAYLTRAKARYGMDGLTKKVVDDYKLAANYAPALFGDRYQEVLTRFQALRAEKAAVAKEKAEKKKTADATGLALKLGGLATGLIIIAGMILLRKKEVAVKDEKVELKRAAAGEIPDRYKLGACIGEGGMGKVYSGEDSEFGRRVAIKELRPELQAMAKERDLFISEARIVAGLKDVHVVEIYDIVHGSDKTFLVFEYVQGQTLGALILASPNRKIDLKKAVDIVDQTCMGLTHAHTQNVIHRDLKPSNIMIEESGNVKVMDFGIARQAKDSLRKAQAGTAADADHYLAPEQSFGKSSRTSDLYSLAVTFYEMLTGQRPFSGGTGQNDKLDGSFTMLSQMGSFPPGLDAFFKRALDPRPEKRFQNTREFMGGIDRAVEGA